MQELIDYFIVKGFPEEEIREKMDLFNEYVQDPSRNRFSFYLHLSDVLGEELLDTLIHDDPIIVRNAEIEHTFHAIQRMHPHLEESELKKIKIPLSKAITPKELKIITKIDSQIAGINIVDLMFIDMLSENNLDLIMIPNFEEYSDNVAKKFLKYETKIFDDNELAEYIQKKDIHLGKYIVELSTNPRRTFALKIIHISL